MAHMKLSTFLKFFKNNFAILLVIIAGVLASRSLLFQSGYFNMHDDLQMMRQLEMEKCFFDLQIPCRWVPDMGYGYGFPLFNFYPPLPYLVGQVFRVLQFSFVDTVKIVFSLSFIISGVTMYYLSKEFFGKLGGVISGVFYIWAPYHSVDVYVRGAMNEAWALVFFPLIFLYSYKLLNSKFKIQNSILLTLSWSGLLLSHNLMVMIFTPVFAFWCLIWIIKSKNFKIDMVNLLKSGFLALGLSAFFTLPAIFEQKFVHVDTLTQGYYEFIAHFATINQLLFSRFWGYGPSVWLEGDGMPFPVGQIHWILSLLIGLFTFYVIFKKKNIFRDNYVPYSILYILAIGWFAVFMVHSRSTFIWQHIKPLAFVQFPWRFLTISTFAFSFVAGAFILFMQKLSSKYYVLITAITIITVIAYNWSFFLPQHGKLGPLSDSEKFAGAAWDLQRTAGIFDYLPKTAKENPKDGQKVLAEIIDGQGIITEMKQGTNWAKFKINIVDDAKVRINLFDFPKWKITLDGREINHTIPDTEKWGRMYIEVPVGTHDVYLELQNTPVRTISNIISLLTWIGFIVYVKKQK